MLSYSYFKVRMLLLLLILLEALFLILIFGCNLHDFFSLDERNIAIELIVDKDARHVETILRLSYGH